MQALIPISLWGDFQRQIPESPQWSTRAPARATGPEKRGRGPLKRTGCRSTGTWSRTRRQAPSTRAPLRLRPEWLLETRLCLSAAPVWPWTESFVRRTGVAPQFELSGMARVTASQLPVPSELSVWAVPSKVALLRARGPAPLRPPSVVPAWPFPRQALPPAPSPPPPLQCLPPSRPRPASAPQCARHTAATPQGPRGPARAGGAAGAAVRAQLPPRAVSSRLACLSLSAPM